MNSLLSVLSNLNIHIFYLLNNGLDNWLFDFLMPLITDFGSIMAWFIIFVLMFLFGGQRTKKVAILGLSALLVANTVVYILKVLVAEPRPFLTLANVDLLVIKDNSFSFPSGHTASSFAAAYVIGSKFKMNFRGRSYGLMYPMMAFAVLIGFSRIYIGVHYPVDVLFGALVGILSAILVLKFWNNDNIRRISKINIKRIFIK